MAFEGGRDPLGLLDGVPPDGGAVPCYITKAAYVVLGITMDGRKDILGHARYAHSRNSLSNDCSIYGGMV